MTDSDDYVGGSPDHRLLHWYVIGGSGSGKTTFLTNILITDARLGHGFCFIDFHGDTAKELPAYIPKERIQDVIFFDPMSRHCPAFNILKLSYEADKLADDLTSIFEDLSQGSWGSRLEDILVNSLLCIIYDIRDNATSRTLLDVRNFIIDENFRADILSACRKPELREFWDLEFPHLGKGALNPVTNKLNKLLRPGSTLRDIFSEPDNEIDFRQLMDQNKILIVRLARGALGERTARTLGNVFIRSIEQAAFSRENIPESERQPFFLVVDEFQNFSQSPFKTFFEETRKFKVYLTLSHQLLYQTNVELKQSVFSNVRLSFVFQVSRNDAYELQPQIAGTIGRYRIRGRSEVKPLDEYIQWAREYLTAEYKKYKKLLATDSPHMRLAHSSLLRDITPALDALRNPHPSVAALREITQKLYGGYVRAGEKKPEVFNGNRLFSDVEFWEEAYPSVDELMNLPPYHVFIKPKVLRMPVKVETLPTPPPNENIRQEILLLHERKAKDRMLKRQATEHQRPTPPPSERPKKKKPKNDDDFLN